MSVHPEHDRLTGLPNQVLFRDRLAQALARCRREGGLLAVMRLEIGNVGCEAGDRLAQLAQQLRAAIRESDTVARIGERDFALLLTGLADPDAARLIADKLWTGLDRALADDGGRSPVWAGVALWPHDGDSVDDLLLGAARALASAKAAGGGCCLAGGRENRARPGAQAAPRARQLERELAGALARRRLTLAFQPQLDLRTERICGCEALIRWRHPDLGQVDPETIVELAERTGQMVRLGEWALAEACAAATRWPHTEPALRIAVNLSASQLARTDLVARVAAILADTGLPAQRLELELTESSMLHDAAAAARTLGELHDLGIRLALDDFGTGYASLSHLKRFTLDALKIDRWFVANLDAPPDAAIVRSLIELGHRLHLRVIAEGVETEAQLATLRRLGCDEAQGHVVGRALGAAGIARWLRARLGTATG